MKKPLLYGSAGPESGREGRERFLIAPLALNRSERRRRLALATGLALKLSGIDRLDELERGERIVEARSPYIGIARFSPQDGLLSCCAG